MENLNGTQIRVTTRYNNAYPYDVIVEKLDESNSSTSYSLKGGYAVSLFLELTQLLNFSYVLVPSVNAYDFSSASKEEIDVFVGSYSLYEQRAKLVDFTFTIGKSRVSAFINHEFESSMKDTVFGPFQMNLWLGLIGFAIILTSALVCAFYIEKRSTRNAYFQSLALILQKDSGFQPQHNGSKLIMWITCSAFMIIFSTYTGHIVSIKSVNRYFINTLESLVNSEYGIHLEFGYNNGSTIQVIAEAMTANPTVDKFLKRSAESKFVFQTFREAIKEVHQKPVAYVIDDETGLSSVNLELGHFPCAWGRIPFEGVQYPWTMFMKKKSPYKSAINSGLLKLEEVGVTTLLRKRWIPQFIGCLASNSDFIAVSYTELRFAYVILVLGILVSILIAIGERFVVSYRTKSEAYEAR